VYVEQGVELARTHRGTTGATPSNAEFDGRDVLGEIEAAPDAVGIVTLAPELPGALDLIRSLTAAGHRVSIGHSAATFDEGLAGIDAGARHATHLFNRMPPFSHRAPGLVGAIFEREEVTAELIADGHHVHPATARVAIRALGVHRTLAITDGTALAGLPSGSVATIGSRRITAGPDVARLEDGTWAGSVLTMDRAFRNVVERFGLGLVEAALLCSANPARAAGASELGRLVPGSPACFAVLDADLRVVQTFVDGVPVLPL
jgi:N-acetylglucosamine-6-phosphate deacetylase